MHKTLSSTVTYLVFKNDKSSMCKYVDPTTDSTFKFLPIVVNENYVKLEKKYINEK